MQNRHPQSVYKGFLVFLIIALSIGTVLWFNSSFVNDNWGKYQIPGFHNLYPFLTLCLGVLGVFIFQREVKLAKSQQLNKDYQLIIKYLEMRIRALTTKLNLAEEKTNTLLAKLKYLNKLAAIPELALFLIEKVLYSVEQYKVDLNIQTSGCLDSLKNIQADDLKQCIDLILTPVYNNLLQVDKDQRRDINLFIKEQDNKVSLIIMHDYVGSPINTDVVEWNVKKLLHKYGANFTVENEKEEESELYVLTLAIDIPKENRVRKVG